MLLFLLLTLNAFLIADGRETITADQALSKIINGEPIYDTLIVGDLGSPWFSFRTFSNPIVIRYSTIQGSINFQRATFISDVDLSHTIITKNANFWQANFQGNALFQETEFNGSSTNPFENSFDFAKFFNNADFSGAKFEKDVSFDRTNFYNFVEFRGTEFDEGGSFFYSTFNDTTFQGANFNGTHIPQVALIL